MTDQAIIERAVSKLASYERSGNWPDNWADLIRDADDAHIRLGRPGVLCPEVNRFR